MFLVENPPAPFIYVITLWGPKLFLAPGPHSRSAATGYKLGFSVLYKLKTRTRFTWAVLYLYFVKETNVINGKEKNKTNRCSSIDEG